MNNPIIDTISAIEGIVTSGLSIADIDSRKVRNKIPSIIVRTLSWFLR